MPVSAIDNLSKDSSDAAIDAAISACIRIERRSGREPDQAVAMCHSMARKKTGKSLGKKE